MPIYKKVFNPYAKYKKKPPSSLSQPTIMPSDIGRYHPPQFFHSQGVSAGSLENNVLGHVGGGTISYGSSPQPFEISMSELVRRDLAEKHAAKPKKLDATPKTLAAMRPPTPEKLAATTPKKLAAKTPKKLAAMKPRQRNLLLLRRNLLLLRRNLLLLLLRRNLRNANLLRVLRNANLLRTPIYV